ncbi:MAG: YggS family pyridoxal phosphate-dependent enzyme [Ilumatobacter sp.]|uniref:YggS family pyridoxal phosphate-dependent enzyme n=1 Tax=Ilumatobacter sp. TaxID=1967498 RepID=UPI00329750F4
MTDDVNAHRAVGRLIEDLAGIRRRIESVERAWDHEVEIVAVTKAFDPSIVDLAVDAGCRAIGENYAQDLLSKRDVIEAFDHDRRPRVDFIGRLQSNKVRQLAGLVDRWATVDRASLAREISKRDPGAEVLVQVNATGEPDKGGCDPDDVAALLKTCRDRGLCAVGLLGIGPTGQPPEAAATAFTIVRALVDEHGLDVCSMGMTADLEVAVRCGATSVRVGSALFGSRPGGPVHQQSGERG